MENDIGKIENKQLIDKPRKSENRLQWVVLESRDEKESFDGPASSTTILYTA